MLELSFVFETHNETLKLMLEDGIKELIPGIKIEAVEHTDEGFDYTVSALMNGDLFMLGMMIAQIHYLEEKI